MAKEKEEKQTGNLKGQVNMFADYGGEAYGT